MAAVWIINYTKIKIHYVLDLSVYIQLFANYYKGKK